MVKEGLLYEKSHEWIEVSGNTGTIGISDHAQEALGSVVFIDLPKVGTTFHKGEVFGAVESVKAASDLFLPVSGKVIEVNEALKSSPELLNENPYDSWILKIEILDTNELKTL